MFLSYWVNPSNIEEAEKYYLQAIALQDDHRSRANIAKLYGDKRGKDDLSMKVRSNPTLYL